MRRAVVVGACIGLAGVASVRTARADGSLVVLVRERASDALLERVEVRLAAELRATAFAVEERVAEGVEDARRLVEEADARGPFATVLLRRTGASTTTEVWVADHVTHKTVVRRMSALGAGDTAERALALHVVELMRASLVEALVLPPGNSTAEPSDAPGRCVLTVQ